MITGTVGCVSRTRFSKSSPLLCCSIKSVSTISTAACSKTSRASSALATAMAFMPVCCATTAHVSRMVGSSSTINMLIAAASRETAASSPVANKVSPPFAEKFEAPAVPFLNTALVYQMVRIHVFILQFVSFWNRPQARSSRL